MAKGTLKYKLYQWKDNRDENSEPMWHARAAKGTTIEFDDLVKHMSEHNSPYSQGVIKGVLTDMLACVKELVLDNKSVRLGDLGTFQIGISSKGAATEEDYTDSLIKKARINFRPGSALEGALSGLTFQKVAVKYTKDEEDEDVVVEED